MKLWQAVTGFATETEVISREVTGMLADQTKQNKLLTEGTSVFQTATAAAIEEGQNTNESMHQRSKGMFVPFFWVDSRHLSTSLSVLAKSHPFSFFFFFRRGMRGRRVVRLYGSSFPRVLIEARTGAVCAPMWTSGRQQWLKSRRRPRLT